MCARSHSSAAINAEKPIPSSAFAQGSSAYAGVRWLIVASLLIPAAMLVGRFLTESPQKLLWLDELYTFYQVEGMNLGRFFESLSSGANLMPPVYFLIVWGLGQFVELTPTVLRGISVLALVGCVPVLFRALKPVVTPSIAALAIGAVFLTDQMVWDQGVEARPYALGILLVALLMESLANAADVERLSAGRWGWLAMLNFLLPATHYFLGLYSAIAFAAVAGVNVFNRRFRWQMYGAFAAGWVMFAVSCGPVLWRQLGNVGAGTGWIPISGRADVWRYAWGASGGVLGVLAGLALAAGVAKFFRMRGHESIGPVEAGNVRRGPGERLRWQMCLGLGLGWSAFPLLVLIVSGLTKRGLFVDRYFAPSVIGMVLIAGLLGEELRRRCRAKSVSDNNNPADIGTLRADLGVLSAVVLATLLGLACVRVVRAPAAWLPGRERLAAEIHALPEVKASDDEHAFFHALYYGPVGSKNLLICNEDAVRVRWRTFSDKVQTTSDEELARRTSFVWLSPEVRWDASDLAAWAGRHGYDFQRRFASEPDGAQRVGWRTYYEFRRR